MGRFERVLWTATGMIIGLLLPATALVADYFILNRGNDAIMDLISRTTAYWFLLILPAIVMPVVFEIRAGRVKLQQAQNEIRTLKTQLDNTEQQHEITNLMEELSMNLDHLVEITNNIHEGICVIDRNFTIEFGFNRPFTQMFGQQDYTGKSIFDTIFLGLLSNTKKEITEFLELCFDNSATADSMINDINPIGKFTISLSENGRGQEKILKSKVVRIKNLSGAVENVMFIFTDVTLDEKLDSAFEKQEKIFQDEMQIMAQIYKNDRDVVVNFINETNETIEKIQQRYLELEQDAQNTELLYSIQGIVHLIKGEAFSLGFDEIAAAGAEFELYIKKNLEESITLEHNLMIIEHYENLYNKVNKVNVIAQKLLSIGEGTNKLEKTVMGVNRGKIDELKDLLKQAIYQYRKKNLTQLELQKILKKIENLDLVDLGILKKELQLVNEKSAIKFNKRTRLNLIYDIDGMPEKQYKLLKEALVHLVRNSIAHGIEETAMRREKGKDDEGRINIHIMQEGDEYSVLYSDDGGGFDLEKIKNRAIAQNIITPDIAESLSENDLINFVFKKGFSTADSIDIISGVGIGMSVVKLNILSLLKGSLRIKNRPEKGITIKMAFA